jgi:hypothetical protein
MLLEDCKIMAVTVNTSVIHVGFFFFFAGEHLDFQEHNLAGPKINKTRTNYGKNQSPPM